jgi:hypothetical protein
MPQQMDDAYELEPRHNSRMGMRKGCIPDSFPGPHLSRLPSVLLCKNNSNFSPQEKLPVHMVLCISSILRVKVLDEPKSSRVPENRKPGLVFCYPEKNDTPEKCNNACRQGYTNQSNQGIFFQRI